MWVCTTSEAGITHFKASKQARTSVHSQINEMILIKLINIHSSTNIHTAEAKLPLTAPIKAVRQNQDPNSKVSKLYRHYGRSAIPSLSTQFGWSYNYSLIILLHTLWVVTLDNLLESTLKPGCCVNPAPHLAQGTNYMYMYNSISLQFSRRD